MILNELFKLTEMIWEDRFTAGEAVKKFPNALIHFTRIPKLGVNPTGSKNPVTREISHSDAPGIYFYPCRYLLRDDTSAYQYANSYPYYYVCSLKPTSNTVNLGQMTTKSAEAIAKRNGWFDDMQRIREDPKILSKDERTVYNSPKLFKKPGGFFWACAHYLANVEKKSWAAILKGIDVIYDPGFGIIATDEPTQYIVMKRNLLTILAHGENKDKIDNKLRELLVKISQEHQLKLSYKHKKAILSSDNDGRPFSVTMDMSVINPFSTSFFKDGFWVTESDRYYRMSDQGDLAHYEENILYKIKTAAKNAGERGPDMYWTADKAKQIIRGLIPRAYRFSEGVRDGELSVSYGDRNFGSFDYFYTCKISKEDVLTVRFECSLDEDRDTIEISKEFPKNTDINFIVEFVKERIVEETKRIFPAGYQNVFHYFSEKGWVV